MAEIIKKKINIKKILASVIFGVTSGFAVSAGGVLDKTDAIELLNPTLWVSTLVMSMLFFVLSFALWIIWDIAIDKIHVDVKKKRIPFWLCSTVMFIAWTPYLLSIFPGVFSYDAYDEWMMVATGNYTTHHPLIHTLFVGGLTEGFYRVFGQYNVGIAIYTVMQMVLLSLAFSYMIFRLERIFSSFAMQLISLLYFSLSPVIGLFSIASVKDTLFCAVETIFLILIFEFVADRDRFSKNRSNLIQMAVFGFLTMILRNNGLYIVLAADVIVILFSLKFLLRSKKVLSVFLFMIVAYVIYAGPMTMAFGAKGGEHQEKLSVFLQQMARVYYFNKDEMSEEEITKLYEYVPEENLKDYLPTLSDRVKSDFNNEAYEKDTLGFFKLWFGLGKKYPLTYVSSFLINTVDSWYPSAVIDGYRFKDRGSYFDYRVAEPGKEVIILSAFHEKLDEISHDLSAQKGIVFLLFFSPGWYLLWFMAFWTYAISRKNTAFSIAGTVFVLHFLTVLLGPIALVRYELNFFYGIPIFIWCLIAERKVVNLADEKE